MQKKEIRPDDFRRYASELQAAVEAVCKSPCFRTSPKSCQFLRHIVRLTLEGKVDELKERLIGIALLGREASYDTGSDAGVRVRANDVRKRLSAYYADSFTEAEFTVDIPPGSYVPRFYLPCSLQSVEPNLQLHDVTDDSNALPALPPAPPLSLHQLALPTCAALFLCVVCMRWQLAQEHPFVTFWQTVFQDHHALLYLPRSPSSGQQELIPVDRLENTAPLLNLAGQFHTEIALTRTLTPEIGDNGIVIEIGVIPASSNEPSTVTAALGPIPPAGQIRLAVDASLSGRQIVDLNSAIPNVNTYGRAALLTISNGEQRFIRIDGTDDEAIDSLIKRMCDPSTFPDELIDRFQEGTVTQIVFPVAPRASAVVFHESLPMVHTAMNRPPSK